MNFTSICLEDNCEPSWDDAKTRLKVAAEVMGFPFTVALDETAYAYKSLNDYIAERTEDGELSDEEVAAAKDWWNLYTTQVTNFPEALAALYPWFHDGESMPV